MYGRAVLGLCVDDAPRVRGRSGGGLRMSERRQGYLAGIAAVLLALVAVVGFVVYTDSTSDALAQVTKSKRALTALTVTDQDATAAEITGSVMDVRERQSLALVADVTDCSGGSDDITIWLRCSDASGGTYVDVPYSQQLANTAAADHTTDATVDSSHRNLVTATTATGRWVAVYRDLPFPYCRVSAYVGAGSTAVDATVKAVFGNW